MSFLLLEAGFKIIDTGFFGPICSIAKRSRMPHFKQNFNLRKEIQKRVANSDIIL